MAYTIQVSPVRPATGPLSQQVGSSALGITARLHEGVKPDEVIRIINELAMALQDQINSINDMLKLTRTASLDNVSGLSVIAPGKASTAATTAGAGSIVWTSADASGQLQAWIQLMTDATAALRRLAIGVVEQGVAFRNITLCELGGQIGIGVNQPTISGTGVLHCSGDTVRLIPTGRTPANSAAAGNDGEMCADNNFVYLHTGGSWRRAALATF